MQRTSGDHVELGCTMNDVEKYSYLFFFFSSRRRHTRLQGDWSSDVCSSDLNRDGTLDSSFNPVVTPMLPRPPPFRVIYPPLVYGLSVESDGKIIVGGVFIALRSEERRVGKECRSRWSPDH